jgi:hypothetical protein
VPLTLNERLGEKMKNVICAIVAFGFTQSLMAAVVKPANTVDTAKGSAVVNQINFDYTVEDRGWHSWGDDSGRFASEKSFMITYSTPVESVSDNQSTAIQLGVDVAQKCGELGRIEYPDQLKSLPRDAASSLNTSVPNSVIFNSHEYVARFVCVVNITAKLRK